MKEPRTVPAERTRRVGTCVHLWNRFVDVQTACCGDGSPNVGRSCTERPLILSIDLKRGE
jgi:hypothetical protein